MKDLKQLNETYGLKNELEFSTMEGDLICARISNKYAKATLSLYGGHIISFKPHNEKDLLWMSPISNFEEGKPIRGGIPICFPWFGPHSTDSSLPLHGIVRLTYWDVIETKSLNSGETCICLESCSTNETKKLWPYDYKVYLEVVIGQQMVVHFKVINSGKQALDYTCAIHTYYNISDIGNIKVEGLQGSEYFTATDESIIEQKDQYIEVSKEENRRHINTSNDCIVHDKGYNRKILAAKKGSDSTVVWNPWSESIKNMPDLPNDGYKNYICIEPTNAFNDGITLQPEEEHTTTAIIGTTI